MLMMVFPRRNVIIIKGFLKSFIRLSLKKQLIDGSYIKEFENEFKNYIGTNYALSVSSGRLALQIILKTLECKEEDEIILPAYTFHAVPKAITNLKLNPVFIDIDEDSQNINYELIEEKITAKTKAIVATHLFGQPCELNSILNIAEKHNLFVIEDCAHAAGAKYNGKRVGSFGKCGYFSFETVKPLNTLGGGMITTNDENIYKKAKEICDSLPSPDYFKMVNKLLISIFEAILTTPLLFTIFVYPFLLLAELFNLNLVDSYKMAKKNFKNQKVRFTNYQAFIGLMQLCQLDQNNFKRALNGKILSEKLDNRIIIRKENPTCESIYYYLIIRSKNIRRLSRKLLLKGIDTGKFVMENCSKMYTQDSECRIAEMIFDESLQIPVSHRMKKEEIEYIARQINRNYDY
ncbi:MAG: DegT/DnrJ/EryC1/StrS family aminotransferase [Candidatus Omnitrophica bacterium]|nr:DegT/DnrJ/EryC1/StrS family aminotransferase [Candidatus Omnitrophota bacterium]